MPVNRRETACHVSRSRVDPRLGPQRVSRSNQSQGNGIVINDTSGVMVAGTTVMAYNANGLSGIQMTEAMDADYRDNTVLRFTVPCDDASVANGGGNVSA